MLKAASRFIRAAQIGVVLKRLFQLPDRFFRFFAEVDLNHLPSPGAVFDILQKTIGDLKKAEGAF